MKPVEITPKDITEKHKNEKINNVVPAGDIKTETDHQMSEEDREAKLAEIIEYESSNF